MKSWMNRAAVMLFVAAFAVAGCGDDASNDSNSANAANNTNAANATNSTNSTNNTNSGEYDNSDKTYESSYQVRFDSLTFDSDTAGAGLNGILAQNFNQSLDYPIVVLVDFKDIDTDAGTLQLRGGSGLKTETDGEYSWDPDGMTMYHDGTLDTATGEINGVLPRLEFVATLVLETETQKVIIPVEELQFSGNLVLSEDGMTGEIPNGRLEGYFTKEEGDNTQVVLTPGGMPVPVTNLFQERNLNYDTATKTIVTAGEGDAWYLKADFTAVSTVIAE